tara:strand:+ start:245 stop:901 length:657 start_codon:yes stop_codon:yes gene_type:complete
MYELLYMPYYPNLNLLFIHIPKTGGSAIEDELQKKNIKSTLIQRGQSVAGICNNMLDHPYKNNSLQHQFYSTIYTFRDKLNVNFENIRVFSVVRNPYDRIISDLIWLKLINRDASPEKVFDVIKNNYLYRTDLDNHNQPQYKFITNDNGVIYPNIIILRCETLNESNDKLNEYIGVSINIRKSNVNKDYSKYLNQDSIHMINEFYKKDFELFNYKLLD